MRIRTLVLALAAASLLLTAACGDDDGAGGSGRPTESEISIELRNEESFPPSSADCVAEVLVGSDLSADGLRTFLKVDLDGTGDLDGSDLDRKDQEALAAVAVDLNTCLGGEPPATGSTPADGSTAPPPDGSATTAPGDTGTTAPAVDGSTTTPGDTASTTAGGGG